MSLVHTDNEIVLQYSKHPRFFVVRIFVEPECLHVVPLSKLGEGHPRSALPDSLVAHHLARTRQNVKG